MNKKAKVVTFSGFGMGWTQEEILVSLEKHLKECRKMSADLICFPEEVLIMGGDVNNPNWASNNQKALDMVRRYAVELHSNIVINLEETVEEYPGKSYNTAYVINREGEILGKYRKKHITFRAIAGRGLPGERVVTVDTDIGKIGLMICFDLGWREDWEELERQGAEIVVWPSAYHGGNLVNAYAAVHMYYIVTSVWNHASRIVSPLGQTIAESATRSTCAVADIYPGAPIYHFDHHESKIAELREIYGDKLFIRVDGMGSIFELALEDSSMTLEEFEKKHGMLSYRGYHEQSTRDNEEMLLKYPDRNI